MQRWLPLILIAALAACQLHATEESQGQAHFKGYGCIRCHRVAGEGGTYGPDLTFVGFRKTPAWIDLWLKNPHGWKNNTVMPNFHLDDQVRASLVAYLASLKGQGYRDNPPWNSPELASNSIKRGEEIFNRVGCVGCHGHGGAGGYPNNNVAGNKIPTLIFTAQGYSKDELKAKISAGVKPAKDDPAGPEPMLYMPAWGEKLKDDEIDALADYLISLNPQSSGGSSGF